MARVNVETRALAEGRFSNLVGDLEATRAETIGTLVLFWHDTQERGIWKASKEELLKFIPFKGRDHREEILQALIDNDYVSPCQDGEFVVRGNRKHIEAFEERREAAAEGGRAKARKVKEIKEALALGSEALPPAKTPLPNSIQSKAIQSRKESNSIPIDFHSQVDACSKTWIETLRSMGIERGILPSEQIEILKAIKNHPLETVDLALYGARWEPEGVAYQPASFASVGRIFGKDKKGQSNLPKFLNWAELGRKKEAEQQNKPKLKTIEDLEREEAANG